MAEPIPKTKYVYIVSKQYTGTSGDYSAPEFKVFKHKKIALKYLSKNITDEIDVLINEVGLDIPANHEELATTNNFEYHLHDIYSYTFKREKIHIKMKF